MGNSTQPGRTRSVEEAVGDEAAYGEALSDNDLLARVGGGDRNAFAVLMKRYLARMVALAQRIVFDREQAREIAQEAFLRVWKLADKWDPDGSAAFSTWLSRVVINLAISCRRRFREQVSLDHIEDLPSGKADGFDCLAASEKNTAVKTAMEKLPARQQAAIALYYFEDLSQIQAAEVMEMTPRAFDSLIVRARVNLKKYLMDSGFRRQEDIS